MAAPAAQDVGEETLIKEAELAAADAPVVPAEKRRKLSRQAAGRMEMSEAETRYLIDEDLRKVGWEADTERLRYSLGTRPQKGKNLAIAEWPTDSSVGKKGFADYALFVGMQLVAIYDPVTGEVTNAEVLEDELDFDIENFNRTVLTEIARFIDPECPEEEGKTLIYAVDDAHADMIVKT